MAAFLLVGVAAVAATVWSLTPRRAAAPWRLFVVRRGWSAARVAAALAAQRFVRDPLAFRLLADATGAGARIEAGSYVLTAAWSSGRILAALTGDPRVVRALDVPAGLTVPQVATVVASSGVVSRRAFLAAARSLRPAYLPAGAAVRYPTEGFLAPGVYVVPHRLPARALVRAMLARFGMRLRPPVRRTLRREHLTVLAWVTLASLVARETWRSREMPAVAAVFLNRLRRHMRLQSDASALYGEGDRPGGVRAALALDTPYNTYRHPGLPPGPIASPGTAALAAVLHPARVGYLYFVVAPDGRVLFSDTYAGQRSAAARLGSAHRAPLPAGPP